MNKIAILYGSSGGNTESVAQTLQELLDNQADLFNVEDIRMDDFKDYPYLILGTSTNGLGDLQDDWDSFLPAFSKSDLEGKTVALFALGDSASYSTSFVDSMTVIYDAIKDKVKIVGQIPDEGYTYDDSSAVIDGQWIGLPIDEDNEYDMTKDRLENWVEILKKEFI